MSILLLASLVDVLGMSMLIRLAQKGRTQWVLKICTILLSLGAASSTVAALELLLMMMSGFAGGFELLAAIGWAVLALLGFSVASRLGGSRGLIASPSCLVGACLAGYSFINF